MIKIESLNEEKDKNRLLDMHTELVKTVINQNQ